MKVELEVSENQLKELDKDLTEFMKNLDDEQKLTLLGEYLQKQCENLLFTNSWGNRELTDFGGKLINGLKEQVSNLYIENYFLNNEELKQKLDEHLRDVEEHLTETINEAITRYIIQHLFMDTNSLSIMVNNQIREYMKERNGEYY